jgi:phosphate-selective porin OprO and OprP
MRVRRVFVALMRVGILATCALTLVEPAAAQQAAQPATPPEKETQKTQENEPQKSTEEKGDWGFRWDNRPSLRLGKGTRVDFRARVQWDIRESEALVPDDEDDSGIDLARRRIGIDGEIINLFDYQVEYEFADDRDPWRDVYINYKQFDFVQVMGGKFKEPFSLDELTSSTNLDFVFRSRAAIFLAPGRDRGVMVHGRVLDRGMLRYELGGFDHDGVNARTNNPERVHGGATLAGRVTVQPLRSTESILSDLMVGAAFTTSDVPEGLTGLRARTSINVPFYLPEVFVKGERRRIGFEARWRPGPFSIKSEYMKLTHERLGQSSDDTDLSKFFGEGWYVSGTWAITGENKADGLDSPRHPLFRGGVGAVELALRLESITFGSEATNDLPSSGPRADVVEGNTDRLVTYGVNWYLNRWIKIQANFVRERISDPLQGPLPEKFSFWSQFYRFQFSM